ncbi:hypothetical protein DFA_07741 [Cavenderia fasciculata]|uniref:Uncharacterized protein n=1 Tax=Cavenderia fasciculata TaxID=261658 RepID=F4Q341_CACFS|nr:uncharacterized protein DFA_07741 [Cavenderia fasciculata]EGG16763.1 hypothetical protein DFA_07741 [Cavenderia fasciculata]|eukprot:XP_004355237.1 hypothetical protein DFA_07741 [Cavenderia fasciculata]
MDNNNISNDSFELVTVDKQLAIGQLQMNDDDHATTSTSSTTTTTTTISTLNSNQVMLALSKAHYAGSSTKAAMTPIYIQFAEKLLSFIACSRQCCENYQCVEITGNGKIDLNNAINVLSCQLFQEKNDTIPPSYTLMASLLVVLSYLMGLSGFGRGCIPNIVKKTLVEKNAVIPRIGSELYTKINYCWNRYYALVDQHHKIVWDQSKMTQYLLNNGIRQFSTSKFPTNPENLRNIYIPCKMVVSVINKTILGMDGQKANTPPVVDIEAAESVIQEMGRMILPLWKSTEKATDFKKAIIISVIKITLLAFETGITNYIYNPLINYLKSDILLHLEHNCFDFKDEIDSTSKIFVQILYNLVEYL